MTPQERSLVLELAGVPGRDPLPKDEFLRQFGASDGMQLGLTLLRDAVQRRNAEDVEWSLIVCFSFGFLPQHFDLLVDLAFAEWHQRHEDVASALAEFRSPAAVKGLVHLAQWVPQYLDYDDARALAVKAIWGLGAIPGLSARRALEQLATAENSIVAHAAMHQLDRDPA